MRLGMMIELDRCVGCLACVSACKERWDSGPGVARDWVRTFEHGNRGKDLDITFYPGMCMHCKDHPCTTECPTGATYARPDGVVVVDQDVCIGCGNCIPMCPYGARTADPQKKIVEKCNLCAPYVARGEQPACVSTCLAECRHYGDLDDPNSDVARLVRDRKAKPLTTAEVNVGPNIYYAPDSHRETILKAGVVRQPRSAELTKLWQGISRPLAQLGVPAFALLAGAGGAVINLRNRKARHHETPPDGEQAAPVLPPELPRHTLGMRFLHWFNAFSWVLLVLTGTALMSTKAFALFGLSLPDTIARLVGGAANLLRLHAAWGLLWALVIVPFFLVFKKGGIEALRELRPTRDDVVWMMRKPLVALGLSSVPLPPQDKYNAGQKAFAASALAGTAVIIASGVIMTFHLGPASLVNAMILIHKLAIALALVGLAVHITMAALVRDERPALKSMLTGRVSLDHARTHATRWVEEIARESHNGDTNPRSGKDG